MLEIGSKSESKSIRNANLHGKASWPPCFGFWWIWDGFGWMLVGFDGFGIDAGGFWVDVGGFGGCWWILRGCWWVLVMSGGIWVGFH